MLLALTTLVNAAVDLMTSALNRLSAISAALALAHGEFDLAIARSRIVRDGRRLVAPAVAPCDELGYAEIAAADKQGDDGDSDIMPLIRLRLRCARRLRISLRDFGGSGGSAPRIGSDPCSTMRVVIKELVKSIGHNRYLTAPGYGRVPSAKSPLRLLVNHRPVLVRSFMGSNS